MAEMPARILLVEDERESREALESLLQIDFDVTSTGRISEAERLLEEQDFDVLLTDYMMPDGRGSDLIARMRDLKPGLLAIVLTGHPEAPEIRRAEQNDAIMRVLTKPFDARRLAALIMSAAQLSRTNRGLEAFKRSPVV